MEGQQFGQQLENTTVYNHKQPHSQHPNHDQIAQTNIYFQDIDSSTSTPFVSAPSSPGRGSPLNLITPAAAAFFYSAPASLMHFHLSPASSTSMHSQPSLSTSHDFEFSARFGISGTSSAASMTSADELFLNGQIRPIKLSSHLQRPQALDPLLDLDESQGDGVNQDAQLIARGRDVKWQVDKITWSLSSVGLALTTYK